MIRIGPARLAAGEVVALGAGLATFGYLAWDQALWDARFQAALHVIAAGAIVGMALLALRQVPVPRTRLETPLLLVLVVLGAATVGSQNLGLSAASLAASICWVLLLPVAMVVVRRRPTLAVLAVSIPIAGLAVGTLFFMLGRRIGWILADGPGLPPVRMPGESTPFGSVAVVPFVLLACLGLTPLVRPIGVRRALQALLVLLGVPLGFLSGSRSAWLALGTAGLVFVVTQVRRSGWRISLPRRPAMVGAVVAGLAVLAAGAIFVAQRVTALTSILYRENLWRDTLRAWSDHPLLGVGPGVMPLARQAAAAPGTFPAVQPHSHDLALGLLGDAGVMGLAAGLILVGAFLWSAGPHRSRTVRGRAAASILVGFLVAGLSEDLTFIPGFDLLILLLVAVALEDAGVVRWQPVARLRPGSATRPVFVGAALVFAAALILPAGLTDTSAVVYRVAADQAWARQWPAATAQYRTAVALDPWQPAGPKALAVAADNAGDAASALAAARRATELSAGDDESWTNLAILCAADGDRACAANAAQKAVDYTPTGGSELANAALVLEHLGNHEAADDAYRQSALVNPQTTIVLAWPRQIDPGSTVPPELDPTSGELNLLVATRTTGGTVDPAQYAAPAVRAFALAMVGDRSGALMAMDTAQRSAPHDVLTWDVSVLLLRHWNLDATRAVRIDEALRGGPLARGGAEPARLTWDVATFRAFPADGLVSGATRLLSPDSWLDEMGRLLPPS